MGTRPIIGALGAPILAATMLGLTPAATIAAFDTPYHPTVLWATSEETVGEGAPNGTIAALVDDDELLEGAVEVVPEGTVGLRGAQVLPVRLDQQTVANLEVRNLLADLHDAHDGLVSGSHRLLVGMVGRDVREGVQVDARHHVGLARVAIELVEQLRIGEADAAGFNLEQDLRRANGVNGFAGLRTNCLLADV